MKTRNRKALSERIEEAREAKRQREEESRLETLRRETFRRIDSAWADRCPRHAEAQ
jgi:hypothetical protein